MLKFFQDIEEDENKKIKVIFLGDSAVGKTNFMNVIKGLKFNEEEPVTMNLNNFPKKMKVNNKEYILEIFDTSGVEMVRTINKMLCRNSEIIILFYNITSYSSFES